MKVVVGQGSCGIATGAKKTSDEFQRIVAEKILQMLLLIKQDVSVPAIWSLSLMCIMTKALWKQDMSNVLQIKWKNRRGASDWRKAGRGIRDSGRG